MGNVFTRSLLIDFSIQWVLFLIAAYLRTEKFYDLAGTSTFTIIALYSLITARQFFPRQVIQTSLVSTWAARLGLFLFIRIIQAGKDRRFDKVRGNPKLFFLYWTVQGLWVVITLLPTLILNSKLRDKQLGYRDYIGWGLWLLGMLIESTADFQKYNFRRDPANQNKWISNGLWGIVRFPNYLGEMILWTGLYLSASSTFEGVWEHASVISPIFVIWLLSRLSGIPILERQNQRRWKDNADFMHYFRNTYRLIPYVY